MNPMELMQIMQSNNPMMLMQQRYGNEPAFQKAMQMVEGKNPQQIKQTVLNLARQKGMDQNQLQQFASMFGLRL